MKQIGRKDAKFGYIAADMFKFESEAAKIIQVNTKTQALSSYIRVHSLLIRNTRCVCFGAVT